MAAGLVVEVVGLTLTTRHTYFKAGRKTVRVEDYRKASERVLFSKVKKTDAEINKKD